MAGNKGGFGLTPDQAYQRRRFRVEISGSGSPPSADKNEGRWKSCSWSGLTWETDTSATTGEDQFTQTTTGLKDWGTLTLVGAITAARDDMIQWYQDTLEGKKCFRTVAITLVDSKGDDVAGSQATYEDCFIEEYRLDELHGQAENRELCETVVIRVGFSLDALNK